MLAAPRPHDRLGRLVISTIKLEQVWLHLPPPMKFIVWASTTVPVAVLLAQAAKLGMTPLELLRVFQVLTSRSLS